MTTMLGTFTPEVQGATPSDRSAESAGVLTILATKLCFSHFRGGMDSCSTPGRRKIAAGGSVTFCLAEPHTPQRYPGNFAYPDPVSVLPSLQARLQSVREA